MQGRENSGAKVYCSLVSIEISGVLKVIKTKLDKENLDSMVVDKVTAKKPDGEGPSI